MSPYLFFILQSITLRGQIKELGANLNIQLVSVVDSFKIEHSQKLLKASHGMSALKEQVNELQRERDGLTGRLTKLLTIQSSNEPSSCTSDLIHGSDQLTGGDEFSSSECLNGVNEEGADEEESVCNDQDRAALKKELSGKVVREVQSQESKMQVCKPCLLEV